MAICNKYTAKWCKIIKLGVTEFYACGCGVLGLQAVNPGQSLGGNLATIPFVLWRRLSIFVFLVADDMREYMIYCDESLSKGTHYSHFYGGVLVGSKDFYRVNTALEEIKA